MSGGLLLGVDGLGRSLVRAAEGGVHPGEEFVVGGGGGHWDVAGEVFLVAGQIEAGGVEGAQFLMFHEDGFAEIKAEVLVFKHDLGDQEVDGRSVLCPMDSLDGGGGFDDLVASGAQRGGLACAGFGIGIYEKDHHRFSSSSQG